MIVKTGVLLFFEHVSLCKTAVSDADGTCVEAELKGIFIQEKSYISYIQGNKFKEINGSKPRY